MGKGGETGDELRKGCRIGTEKAIFYYFLKRNFSETELEVLS